MVPSVGKYRSRGQVRVSDKARVFIAVHLPEPQLATLELTVADLRKHGLPKVRWVRPEGIHLTLKFLGNIPASQIEAITVRMTVAAQESFPFRLALGTLGVFPNARKARVLWCGVDGDMALLSDLQLRTETALGSLGYPPENRLFSPHLTLGRVREGDRGPGEALLEQALIAAAPRWRESWLVDEVCLMQTTSMPGGSRYDVIATAKLGGSS